MHGGYSYAVIRLIWEGIYISSSSRYSLACVTHIIGIHVLLLIYKNIYIYLKKKTCSYHFLRRVTLKRNKYMHVTIYVLQVSKNYYPEIIVDRHVDYILYMIHMYIGFWLFHTLYRIIQIQHRQKKCFKLILSIICQERS